MSPVVESVSVIAVYVFWQKVSCARMSVNLLKFQRRIFPSTRKPIGIGIETSLVVSVHTRAHGSRRKTVSTLVRSTVHADDKAPPVLTCRLTSSTVLVRATHSTRLVNTDMCPRGKQINAPRRDSPRELVNVDDTPRSTEFQKSCCHRNLCK